MVTQPQFLFSLIFLLLINSSKFVFNKKFENDPYFSFERAWWVSIFIFLLSQLADVQYFDGRISIVFWLLLSGLKKIIDENKSSEILNANNS